MPEPHPPTRGFTAPPGTPSAGSSSEPTDAERTRPEPSDTEASSTEPSRANRLLGREHALAAVTALLTGAANGTGGGLVVHGSPGTGRTALLRRAATAAAGWRVLSTAGVAVERTLALAGLHRLLDPVREEIVRSTPEEGARLARAMATGTTPASPPLDLLAVLRGLAATGPVLCLVDDASWLDGPSLDALAFVARRCDHDRLAVLFAEDDVPTGRLPDDHSPATEPDRDRPPPDRLGGIPRQRLTELDQRSSLELLQAHDVPGDLAGALADLGCGNPQGLLDLARSLPAPGRGTASLPATLPRHSRSCRTHLRLVEPLAATTRRLLLIVAADERLSEDELARAAEAAGLDLADLRPAEEAGIVEVRPDGVRLRPPLLRTVVYHAATVADRRATHAVLVRCLSTSPPSPRSLLHRALSVPGPDPHLAAQLAEAADEDAGDHLRAALALERAARLTTEPATADEYRLLAAQRAWLGGRLHRARLLLEEVGTQATPARIRTAARVLRSEIDLTTGSRDPAFDRLLAISRELGRTDRELALTTLLRMGSAVYRLGHEDLLPELARRAETLRRPEESPDEELAFEQLNGMAAVHEGDLVHGVTSLRRVLALAEDTESTDDLLRACYAGILVGDDVAARRMAARAVALARERGEKAVVPQAVWLGALADFALGRYPEATALVLDARELARANGQEDLIREHLAMLAVLAAVAGDRDTALAHLRELREHVRHRETAPSPTSMIADWALSVVDLIDGNVVRAFHRLDRLAGPLAPPGHQIVKTALFCYLVEAAAKAGETDDVFGPLARFETWTRSTGNPGWTALACRSRALVTEDDAEADERFQEAHRLHLLADSDLECARTDLLHGQRLRRRRQPRAARPLLQAALETFERMGAGGWADQARTDLRAAGERVPAPSTPVDPTPLDRALTPQQHQIARLAASGATNQEIAGRLFLSVRTVEYHLGRIFTRLGIRSRVELAGYASDPP